MRVVPSDVVRQIQRLFKDTKFDPNRRLTFYAGHRSHFSVILELVGQIPVELMAFDAEDFCTFQTAEVSMRSQMAYWAAHGDQSFDLAPGYSTDPVTLLYFLLSKCPDVAPASATTGLDFLKDEIQRRDLRTDKSDSDRALSSGEWKAATVLAGSLVEALLLWAVQQEQAKVASAVAAIQGRGVTLPRASRAVEDWNLHEYIEVSSELGIIGEKTAEQCRLAKGFRNLIHPGAEQRRSEKCGRPEALAAAAAVEHVIRDLSR